MQEGTRGGSGSTTGQIHACGAAAGNRCCCRGTGPQLRLGALATGSVVGIATWALLYVLGGLVAALCGATSLIGAGGLPLLAMGTYGAVAANVALYLASFLAAWCGGRRDPATGILYGLTVSAMANITLVAVAAGLCCGVADSLAAPLQGPLLVGAAAIGYGASPAQTLGAMLAVMLLSIVSGTLGGWQGARRCA